MGRPLILFGAGASYGSDTCGTPALMEGLFDALQSSSEHWRKVSGESETRFRQANEFEPAMADLLKTNPCLADVLHKAMADYFFRFPVRPTNLYVKLANRIRNAGWDGTLATLNYDMLLKLALEVAGVPFKDDSLGGLDNAATELCYLHGCCHLFCNIRTESSIQGGGAQILGTEDAIIRPGRLPDGTETKPTLRSANGGPIFFHDVRLDSKQIRRIQDADQHAKELQQSTVLPIMCYIEPDKRSQSGLSFLQRQRKRFECWVHSASVVAIVGVGYKAHDMHIWGPLAATPARIVYCGGRCGAMEFRKWVKGHRAGREDLVLEEYFKVEFDRICRAVGLP